MNILKKLWVDGTVPDGNGEPLYGPDDKEYIGKVYKIEGNQVSLSVDFTFVWPHIPTHLKAGDLVNICIDSDGRVTLVL